MSPLTWTIMTFSLFTSTLIVMASHNWMLVWLALELNTLSIIPIIIKTHHPRSTEAATKYFLIQAAAAAIILLSGTLNTWQTGQWSLMYTSPLATTTMMLAILMKLGLAPFHFWYPEVLQGTTMFTALVISTWQKIAPLTLLYMITQTPSTNMLIIGLTSALIGGWLGLNQTQTRKLMAFSSIAHMGWLVAALTLNPKLATMTLIIYIFMTMTVFLALAPPETKTVPDLATLHSCYPTTTSVMLLTLLSLGGLPPLSGFMPKWLILNELVTKDLLLLATLLALASLPSLYFYTRMTYLTTLTTPPNNSLTEHKWRLKPNFPMSLMILAPLATLLLPVTPLLANTL
uniref:NADH-ubiquinone oxidoreductase chain 2 n=2 Tax=Lygodactylus incognitus TaxID=1537685 RepID=A0A077GY13_9SAUR|nr:NADH dehydrogenase subunit 2 [Lygodactylus nigropunctatus incognitus]AIL82362.1 NADH dehydrogenase subunit 2 [Lygodactylus nigropunctatus incognitus]AIL82363.1 NADH dehydrogenase subunit 2 [Lygodactylus nigropunctatus incognitus]AIL82364.1 NADH dehydrogenase subunit 2 [Lygodactylus nigropunctatus incognitus]AIL82365.1 NADH dehydrogenase subunit 2 [Lygodactylus nigropunctatus incognitus]